ncbi:hypothetical protein Ddye_024184 [Dipteronia dyeriana]|uniref:Uncharacterized protein n=1 Tax=Dipteronia dyeriana TaxID=168575 RepID=A0AAD9WTC2_9ROSI|nr:hypothetical protein Ddye_024184 [Dipteronia dyeriana]
MSCTSCGSNTLTPEDATGTIQKYSNYDPQIFGRDGPTGSGIHLGSSGIGSSLNYKDKKIYESKRTIDDTASALGLTDEPAVVNEIRDMINQITKGEFGLGEWFLILNGACAYVVKRQANVLLPLAKIASALNCDEFELDRMITRVVRFLNLKLPEVDIFIMFERVFRDLPQLSKLESDKLGQMRKQRIFMLNCAVKWFLSTGRRPMPVVVAVFVFVAEVNGVDVRIKDVALDTHGVALPWGKDVNVKNILKNAMYVMSYMEMKSMEKRREAREGLKCDGVDLDDVEHKISGDGVASDTQYFEMDDRSGSAITVAGEGDTIQHSHECLKLIYTKFSNEIDGEMLLGESGQVFGRERSERFEFQTCWKWWNGNSEFSRKLFLKQLLEKDVGLDILPPSFVKGCMDNKRRRAKINSAKVRIGKIMHPSGTDTVDNDDVRLSECEYTGKRRKRKRVDEIDWEDFVIETLRLKRRKSRRGITIPCWICTCATLG